MIFFCNLRNSSIYSYSSLFRLKTYWK